MRYKFFVIIILLITIGLANFKFHNNISKLPKINDIFPKNLGDWKSQDLIAADNVYKMIPKDQLLFRKYINTKNNEKINLSIVLTNERETIHDPQICYRAQGIEMTNQKVIEITPQKSKVHYVYGLKLNKPYTIIYWYTNLKKTFPNRAEFMKNIAFSKFWNKPLDAFALVIVMAPSSIEKDVIDFSENANKILLNLDK